MKVKLITINDLNNYGNRLQNYATQQFLISNSIDVENIVDETYYPLVEKKTFRSFLVDIVRKKRRTKQKFKKNFLKFNQYIWYSGTKVKTSEELRKNGVEDKIIIVGSDQVWNPKFAMSDVTLLDGVKCKKKISFSASFGVDSIPYDQTIADCLNDFKALSVREEAGAKIIKDLTGRDATVLVDPTMLLTNDEWRKVSKKPRGAKEGYVLTYFLSPKCDEAKTKLEEIKEDKEVYELLNPNDKIAGTAGPSEFLWLFEHADLILTDSFHACVFSFLFNKPFIVYDRNWNEGNMNSRLETLLSKFSLERKYANSGLPNDLWEHDYTEGYKQLEIERKKAIDFLKKALED